jgi:hypothetical protein
VSTIHSTLSVLGLGERHPVFYAARYRASCNRNANQEVAAAINESSRGPAGPERMPPLARSELAPRSRGANRT